MKKGTGNSLLRDNTTILDSTTAAVNIARRVDVEPRVPELKLVQVLLHDIDQLDAADLPHVTAAKVDDEAILSTGALPRHTSRHGHLAD
ncbi:hypothetical protein cypCar_00044658 [Cyprinus carpio]|nr:hypothetical protein cypCar_00044658 [Cyprinus carpio]